MQNENSVLLLRVSEAARILSISRSRAYELCAERVLPTVKIGTSIRVPVKELEKYVQKLQEEAGGS